MKPSHYPSDNILALVQLLGWKMDCGFYGANILFDNPYRWYHFAGSASDGKWRAWIKSVAVEEGRLAKIPRVDLT